MSKSRFYSNIVVIALFITAVFCAAGCNRHKQVPDSVLAHIFHDAFLANAYTMSTGIQLDSLKLYEPIFNKYGYSVEDVQRSIGSFATRKSARLSDVVERAITMLEEEGMRLDKEVGILDTVDRIAVRRATKVVLKRDSLHLKSPNDTTTMRFVLRNIEPGTYRIEFDYFIDSLNTAKKGFAAQSWSGVDGNDREFNRNHATLTKGQPMQHSSNLVVDDTKTSVTIKPVVLLDEAITKNLVVNVRLKNLTVTHTPQKLYGRDKTYEELLNITLLDHLLPAKSDVK